jgi:hypothetical protein
LDTPPPTFFSSHVELTPESNAVVEEEVIQHLVNTTSTVIQHTQNVEGRENESTVDEVKNTETQKFSQHTTKKKGERGGVEQGQLDDILQKEQSVTFAIAQQDTSSQTKSLDSTSGQEAITNKYQPVEVLNSEEEWVSGYFVHKCLEVANLEGIERK